MIVQLILNRSFTPKIKKWKVLTVPWRSTSKNHKKKFLILVYLTNLKIKKVPLRDEDYFVDETESEEEYENIPCNCDECSESEDDENEENEDHSDSEIIIIQIMQFHKLFISIV
ncbi:hypothetical protein DICPUDRAFT_79419 [Dictyostelium purpureum]|uniref:Uncharacterized protein n=1 Tax=Dictyostelium purpureum TaxID=5786 RepID=F0ZMJ3_DICPU|nr:uncharacterized protein DICPUDRAFT_79419 [Dictyostelium purpureum]EGC34835.1 hypothetical protein DICPUDRAFT_79419 [Dictyostelium purpureum]|eukprot:XP_003288642.1 hypothetical protein DICPUDRAFT_79419 [Dictyostelium purpureum]